MRVPPGGKFSICEVIEEARFQQNIAKSVGIRNKKPIFNHVIYIFCSLKVFIRMMHFEESLKT